MSAHQDSAVEAVARALTPTLRHHGVEMHPDDLRGLAQDAIAAMPTDTTLREQRDELLEALEEARFFIVHRAIADSRREAGLSIVDAAISKARS